MSKVFLLVEFFVAVAFAMAFIVSGFQGAIVWDYMIISYLASLRMEGSWT